MLPYSLVCEIASWLVNDSRMRVGLTCRALRHVCTDHTVWTNRGARLDRLQKLQRLHGLPCLPRVHTPACTEAFSVLLVRMFRWRPLVHAPLLQELCLRNSGVDDVDMYGVAEFAPQLRRVDVAATHVNRTQWLLPTIERRSSEEQFSENVMAWFAPGAVPPVWSKLEHLTMGSVDGCFDFSEGVGQYLPALRHLCVESAEWERYCLPAFCRLHTLRMDGMQAVMHSSAATQCSLQHVHVSFLQPTTFRKLPRHLRTLEFDTSLDHWRACLDEEEEGTADDHAEWKLVCAEKLPLPSLPRLTRLCCHTRSG